MPKPIRRVVTGHDAAGRSVFIMDGAPPHVYQRSPGSAVVTELWETRMMPAENGGNAEATIADIAGTGVDAVALAARLQREGTAAFDKSWQDLLACIAAKSALLEQEAHTHASRP